ncbi:Phage tail assembly chaperone protein, E, or 41 or 14 [Devosia crocina]|uniref:Phage tail assembly chaperone protein, E, or 41 or 14 n=1 Tax=Devosia crocina TaxID=429728 RepID=A0A1I7NC51_9HYPH|nr:phage tail assembly protein [Devosia crocina]SFV32255.1 Phage tail assembly chaperone protein, E, or 41 or 14 [Devosia crocina]
MTSTPTPTTEAAPTSAVEYLGAPRAVTIPLKHAFRIGEQEYREVVVRRPTGHEVKAYGFAVSAFWRDIEAGRSVQEPLYPGIELPREALAALDDDDLEAIEEAADGFFPDRLRPVLEAHNGMLAIIVAPASALATGESGPAS